MVRQGRRLYWTAAESKVYAEPNAWPSSDTFAAPRSPGGPSRRRSTGSRRRGAAPCATGCARPPLSRESRTSAHLRLLAGDQISDEEILGSLAGLRAQLAELGGLVEEMRAGEARLPEKSRNLALAHSLARRLVDTYGEWIDEVAEGARLIAQERGDAAVLGEALGRLGADRGDRRRGADRLLDDPGVEAGRQRFVASSSARRPSSMPSAGRSRSASIRRRSTWPRASARAVSVGPARPIRR